MLAVLAPAAFAQTASQVHEPPIDHSAHAASAEALVPPDAVEAAAGDHGMHAGVPAASEGAMDAVVVDFELIDRHGNTVRDEDFRGRYLLLGFGFTNCPHICPLMAFNMGGALAATEHDAAGIFVSIDTERDTAAVSDDYATRFGERMLGLGGSLEQINSAAKNFRVSYVVTKTQSNYTVQHTAMIYLIDPDGRLLETFAVTSSPEEIVASMR